MIVYLNNILIFTWTLEKYYRVISKVLKILVKYKLHFWWEKYKFDKQQIKYLGLVILKDQVEMSPVKVTGVCDWQVLKKIY